MVASPSLAIGPTRLAAGNLLAPQPTPRGLTVRAINSQQSIQHDLAHARCPPKNQEAFPCDRVHRER